MNLKSRLQAGESLIGSFLAMRSPDVAELMSVSGFDFLIIDTEHSNLGPDGVLEMCRAVERGAATPLVRVSETSPGQAQWALDGGAKGILFPRIRSVDEAREAVSFCRYPPEGRRGLGPGRASVYGTDIPGYAATANQEILAMIQIETLEAVDCLEEIAAIPGTDILFIGPGDLSHALGFPRQLHHPQVLEVGERMLTACRQHDLAGGIMAIEEDTLSYWRKQGMQFLATGTEAMLLNKSCQEWLRFWKKTPPAE